MSKRQVPRHLPNIPRLPGGCPYGSFSGPLSDSMARDVARCHPRPLGRWTAGNCCVGIGGAWTRGSPQHSRLAAAARRVPTPQPRGIDHASASADNDAYSPPCPGDGGPTVPGEPCPADCVPRVNLDAGRQLPLQPLRRQLEARLAGGIARSVRGRWALGPRDRSASGSRLGGIELESQHNGSG